MRLFSWNIQSGKGCDGLIDIYRIIDHIKSTGDYDFICLQEVARNMDEYCARGQMDQMGILANAFSDFSIVWGTGFSWPVGSQVNGHCQEFGNLTLIRNPLLDQKVHPLPMPAAQGKKQMPRVAVEAVVNSTIGPLSVINTHLAYHDGYERKQQLERLNLIDHERKNQILYPKKSDTGAYQKGPLPVARVLCGDFNFGIEYPEHALLVDSGWIDAWAASNTGKLHSPTCGLFDHRQWPQGPHCRDFFWLSNELESPRLEMEVDTETRLSDHQPIVLEIDI